MTPPWDSYAHIGLHRGVLANELLAEMDRCGVARATLVPFLNAPNFDDLLQAAQTWPDRFIAVCRADLDRAQREGTAWLDGLLASGFRGARVALPPAPAAPGDAMESILASLDRRAAVLVVHCPDGFGAHTSILAGWLHRYTRLRVFIPHLGWPRTAQGETTPGWDSSLQQLADAGSERVFMGLSALYFYSGEAPPFRDTFGYVQAALQAFSAARCVLGGDYPMTLERCTYPQVWEALQLAISDDSALERMGFETPQQLWQEPA